NISSAGRAQNIVWPTERPGKSSKSNHSPRDNLRAGACDTHFNTNRFHYTSIELSRAQRWRGKRTGGVSEEADD
ncbi:hypothetical protein KUCAC02_026451, partial [Chaenocephalus aceratus]